jgi:predicted nucleic acid-binding protein
MTVEPVFSQPVFLDTNVLLYALSAGEVKKQARAEEWIASAWNSQNARVSWQVMHEFYAKATQKLGVSSSVARTSVRQFLEWDPVPPSQALIERAWHWCDKAQINFWDAMIVAAAEHTRCRHLLSEDFQAGRKFGNVTVLNPFEQSPNDLA